MGQIFFTRSLRLALVLAAIAAVECGKPSLKSPGTNPKDSNTNASSSHLDILPKDGVLPVNLIGRYRAVFTDDKGAHDVSSFAEWSSSSDDVIKILNSDADVKGIAKAQKAGTATITAKKDTFVATLDIEAKEIKVSSLTIQPATALMVKGQKLKLEASGQFQDGQTREVSMSAFWSSGDEKTTKVVNDGVNKGEVEAVAVGKTTIRATFGGVEAKGDLEVTNDTVTSVTLAPQQTVIAIGAQVQLVATGTLSSQKSTDLSRSVKWSSADASIASVDQYGQVKGVKDGETTITADFNGKTGSSKVKVTSAHVDSISIVPATTTIKVGSDGPLDAIGHYSDGSEGSVTDHAAWASADESVVSVAMKSSKKVFIFGKTAGGPVTITASIGGVSGTATVTVSATSGSSTPTPSGSVPTPTPTATPVPTPVPDPKLLECDAANSAAGQTNCHLKCPDGMIAVTTTADARQGNDGGWPVCSLVSELGGSMLCSGTGAIGATICHCSLYCVVENLPDWQPSLTGLTTSASNAAAGQTFGKINCPKNATIQNYNARAFQGVDGNTPVCSASPDISGGIICSGTSAIGRVCECSADCVKGGH